MIFGSGSDPLKNKIRNQTLKNTESGLTLQNIKKTDPDPTINPGSAESGSTEKEKETHLIHFLLISLISGDTTPFTTFSLNIAAIY